MLKTVVVPAHVEAGIKRNHRAYPMEENLHVFGADTETVRGLPHTIQFAWADGKELKYVDERTVTGVFCRTVFPHVRAGKVNVCYVHNLNFDLPVLFHPYHSLMYEQVNDIEIYLTTEGEELEKNWFTAPEKELLRVLIMFGKVNAARFEWGSHWCPSSDLEETRFDVTRRLYLFDSSAFTHASLKNSLKMFQIPEVKLTAPKGLGTKRLKGPEFEEYALQDAVAVRALGLKIMELHERYQARPSVSLPQFAARVFRHHFMGRLDVIQFPSEEVRRAAELSYHGGKNGMYCAPGVYQDCVEVDINSAYPWAMSRLPDFVSGKYRRVDAFAEGLHGVYCVSGDTDPAARYPLIFDHAFKRLDGHFEDIWTTGYEVERARSSGFVRFTKIWGYVWEPSGEPGENPFFNYVAEFYKKKETTPKTDPNYNFYKLMLNSLYGKFVGTIENHHLTYVETDGEMQLVREDYRWDGVLEKYVKADVEHTAGGLYNPFVATLITGAVRAKLWDLETEYQALHSSTDSIKTTKPIKEKAGLGGWKKEVKGPCWIFRNKLYLHYDGESGEPGKGEMAELRDAGRPLRKYAMHGFKGKLREFHDAREQLLRDGGLAYSYQHVVGLREGLRRRETPGDFVMRDEYLSLTRRAGPPPKRP